jgi:hypothetical protein
MTTFYHELKIIIAISKDFVQCKKRSMLLPFEQKEKKRSIFVLGDISDDI